MCGPAGDVRQAGGRFARGWQNWTTRIAYHSRSHKLVSDTDLQACAIKPQIEFFIRRALRSRQQKATATRYSPGEPTDEGGCGCILLQRFHGRNWLNAWAS